ncbi:GTP-binding protein Obg [Olavius algarvensis associated proteobacterium Delta 3]|nr:GTP-binding protein Obg [Olavius algarvensis associated proteobacterium Delta 3]
MKFIDEATITVQSGDGGRGCVSFRRERFIPKGGPDGGDGGQGGDVILMAAPGRRTLYRFRYRREFKAPNGAPGQGRQKTGKSGAPLIIEVPPGTLVINEDSETQIYDFTTPGETCTVARGGRGGKGNTHFKSSTHRTPRFGQPGEPGELLRLRLELKLLADVGLIGLPNAGKSTLISVLSSARPKIADYPFTTLTPNLGMVPIDDGDSFVMADIPGLIEGAHTGLGLGINFLKHIERTRLLVHLIDAAAVPVSDPLQPYETINRELAAYSDALARKPQIVVLNKIDVPEAAPAADAFTTALGKLRVLRISAATRSGMDQLMGEILRALDRIDEA